MRRHKNYVAANITPGFGDYVSSRLFSHFSKFFNVLFNGPSQNSHCCRSSVISLSPFALTPNRSIDRRPNGASPAIKQPTSSQHQISNARTRAATADALMDQFLLGHSSSSSKICLRHLHSPPATSTSIHHRHGQSLHGCI